MAALDYLTKEVAGAVDRYMSILSHVGYKSYCTVDKLLVYSFIEEILTKFNIAVTEDDYNSMANVLNCLYGSCMIPFPYYVESTIEPEETPLFYYDYFRLSEDNNLRATENNNLRLKA